MKTQATLFDDLLIEVDRNSDKLLLGKAKVPLKPVVNRGVAEIYDEVERVFAQVKTLLPYIEKYELITSIERLQDYMKKVKENGVIAIDTETDGLDLINDKIAGVSIYTKGESPAYIPIRHEYYDHNVQHEVMTQLLKALKRDGIKIIMHNAKFDMRVLFNNFGLWMDIHYDTFLAAKALDENEEAGLKALWAKYVLGKGKQFSYSELFENIKFSAFNPEKVYIYAALDALMTYELWEFQNEFLDPTNPKCIERGLEGASNVFYNIEMKVAHIVARMEQRGIGLDLKYAQELDIKYREILHKNEVDVLKALKELEGEWKPNLTSMQLSKLGDPINVSSSAQLAIILFDGLGCVLPPGILKKGKTRGVGKEAIVYFIKHYPQYDSFWKPYARYQLSKTVYSTFVVGIPKFLNKTTNRVHASWNSHGTVTGRFSSGDPNL